MLEPLAPAFLSLAVTEGLSESAARSLWNRYCVKSANNGYRTSVKGWLGWVRNEVRGQRAQQADAEVERKAAVAAERKTDHLPPIHLVQTIQDHVAALRAKSELTLGEQIIVDSYDSARSAKR